MVIDLFSRQVVGCSLREDMTPNIVIDALRMAWLRRHPSKHGGLMFHSARGDQYARGDFRETLKSHGILASMMLARQLLGASMPAARHFSAR